MISLHAIVLALDDLMYLPDTLLENVVYHQIIILRHELGLFGGDRQSLGDDLRGLRSPAHQPLFQLVGGGRHHKEQNGVRVKFPHLKRSLDLDLKDHILPLRHQLFHIVPGRPVGIAVEGGIFQQLPVGDHCVKFLPCLEEILPALLLAVAHLTRGGGNGETVFSGIGLEKVLHDGTFSRSGKSR